MIRPANCKFLLMNAILVLYCTVQVIAEDKQTVAANASVVGGGDTKVTLGVYCESLCPDTRRFFLNQLVPTHRQIGQIMDVKIVPFGHARTIGNNKMICQHGAKECEGNRRMACLMARSKNQTQIVETLGCLFGANESEIKQCVNNNMPGVDFDDIEKCKSSDESYQLMIQAEKDTGKVGYVPHLTVNGQFSEEIQDEAEQHLKDYMCKQYKGSQPEQCTSAKVAP